jgi:hypothetical protein
LAEIAAEVLPERRQVIELEIRRKWGATETDAPAESVTRLA